MRSNQKKRGRSQPNQQSSKKPKEDKATKKLRIEKEKEAANLLHQIKLSFGVDCVPNGTTEDIVSQLQAKNPKLDICIGRVQNHLYKTKSCTTDIVSMENPPTNTSKATSPMIFVH